MRKPSRRERGFTLIEVMISTGLLTLVLGSLMVMLSDYSQIYEEVWKKNSLMTLRRRVIQTLNRREAWILTYQAPSNPSFSCFLSENNTAGDCPGGDNHFTLYGGREFPPTPQSVVFSRSTPPLFTSYDPNYGLTRSGEYCNTFVEMSTAASAKRCPFRLDLTWRLVSFGIPSPTTADPLYYPTGYFPFGHYPGTGPGSYFGPTFFPGAGSNPWWWLGTLAAQVEVRGRFTVNVTLKKEVNAKNYDFTLVKEVP